LNRYDDMILLPHHVSSVHPRMPVRDRAAQFSPFAALNGYEEAIQETGRLTTEQIELNEDATEILNEKLIELKNRLPDSPRAEITYFVPDGHKEGGAYVTVSGIVKSIDGYARTLAMQDGLRIPLEDITDIEY